MATQNILVTTTGKSNSLGFTDSSGNTYYDGTTPLTVTVNIGTNAKNIKVEHSSPAGDNTCVWTDSYNSTTGDITLNVTKLSVADSYYKANVTFDDGAVTYYNLTIEHKYIDDTLLQTAGPIQILSGETVTPSAYQMSIGGYDYNTTSPSDPFVMTEDTTITIYYTYSENLIDPEYNFQLDKENDTVIVTINNKNEQKVSCSYYLNDDKNNTTTIEIDAVSETESINIPLKGKNTLKITSVFFPVDESSPIGRSNIYTETWTRTLIAPRYEAYLDEENKKVIIKVTNEDSKTLTLNESIFYWDGNNWTEAEEKSREIQIESGVLNEISYSFSDFVEEEQTLYIKIEGKFVGIDGVETEVVENVLYESLKTPETSFTWYCYNDTLLVTIINNNKKDRNIILSGQVGTISVDNNYTIEVNSSNYTIWENKISSLTAVLWFRETLPTNEIIETDSIISTWNLDDEVNPLKEPSIEIIPEENNILVKHANDIQLNYSVVIKNELNNEEKYLSSLLVLPNKNIYFNYADVLNENNQGLIHTTATLEMPEKYDVTIADELSSDLYWSNVLQNPPSYNFIWKEIDNSLAISCTNQNSVDVVLKGAFELVKENTNTSEDIAGTTIESKGKIDVGTFENISKISTESYFDFPEDSHYTEESKKLVKEWTLATYSFEKSFEYNNSNKIVTIKIQNKEEVEIPIIYNFKYKKESETDYLVLNSNNTTSLPSGETAIEIQLPKDFNFDKTIDCIFEFYTTQDEIQYIFEDYSFKIPYYQKDTPIAVPGNSDYIEKVFINNQEKFTVYGEEVENTNLITDADISELFENIPDTAWDDHTGTEYWYTIFLSTQYTLELVKPLESGAVEPYNRKQIVLKQDNGEGEKVPTVLWSEPTDTNTSGWNTDFATNPLIVEDDNATHHTIGVYNNSLTRLFSMSPYFGIVPEDESQPKPIPTDGTIVKTIYVNTEKLSNSNILSLIKETLGNDQEYRVFQSKEGNKIKFEVCIFRTDIYREKYHLYIIEDGKIILWWDSYDGWDSKYTAESFKVNLSNNTGNEGKNEKLTALFSITPYFASYTKEVEMPIKPKSVPEENDVNVEKIYFNTKYTGNYIIYNISRLTHNSGGVYTLYYNKDNDISITITYGQVDDFVSEDNPYGYIGNISFKGIPIWDWTPETSDAEWDFGKMINEGFREDDAGNYYFVVNGKNDVNARENYDPVSDNHKVVDIFSIEPLAENGGGDEPTPPPTPKYTVTFEYVDEENNSLATTEQRDYDKGTSISSLIDRWKKTITNYEFKEYSVNPDNNTLQEHTTIRYTYKVKENGGGETTYPVTCRYVNKNDGNVAGSVTKSCDANKSIEEIVEEFSKPISINFKGKTYEYVSTSVEPDIPILNQNITIIHWYEEKGSEPTTCKVTAIYQNEKGTLIAETVEGKDYDKGTSIAYLVNILQKTIENYEFKEYSVNTVNDTLQEDITITYTYKSTLCKVTITQGEPYEAKSTTEYVEENGSINLGDYVQDDNKNYKLSLITVDGKQKSENATITVNKNLEIKYTYAPTGGGGGESTTCKVTAIYQNEKGTLIETTAVDENCKKGTPISELVTRFEKKIENHVLKEYSVSPVSQENDTLQEETTITYIYTTLHKVTITQSEPYEAKSTTAYVEENGIINLGDYVQNDNANYKLHLITVNGEPKSKDEPITVTEDLVITYTYILDNNADTDTEYPGNVGEDKEIQYREVFVSSVFRGVVHPSIKTELPEPEEIEGLEDLYYIDDPYKALHKPVINLEWSGENGFSNEQVTILGNQFDALITPICFNKFPDSDNNSYIGTFIAYFYNGQKAYSFKYSIVEDEEKQYHTRPFKMWIPSQVTAIGGDWHVGIEYQKTGQDSNGNERIVTAVSNTIQAHVVPNFLVAGDLNEDDVQDNIFTPLNDVNSYALMATSYDIDGNPVYTPIQTLEATGESYNLAYSGTEIDSLLGWVNTNRNQVIAHLENTTIHITAEERELWNTISSKADTTALQEEVNRATQAESILRNNINAKANQTDLTALEDRVEETEKFIEEFDSTVINPINEHTQQIKDLQTLTTEHTSDIEELKDEDADLIRKINLINSDIDVIELNVQTNKADIGILKDDVNAFNTNIATQLNAEIAARATKDTQLEAAINKEIEDRNQAINQEVEDRNKAIEIAKSELDKNIDEVDNKIDEKFNQTTNSLVNINQKITDLELADIQNTNLINQVDEKVINLQNDTSIVRNNSTTEGVTTFVMKIVFLSSEEEYETLEIKEAGTLYLIREEEE